MAMPGTYTGTPHDRVERAIRSIPVGGSMKRGDRQHDGEALLLARIARGDGAAFEDLYDRYSRAVYSLAVRLSGNAQAAQEITQEIFLGIWSGARDFDPQRGSARSWVLSLAHHKSVDAVRRLRLRVMEPLTEAGVPNPPHTPDIVEEAIRTVERASVREALRALSHEQREAIVLAYYGGYTQQEIAGRLGIPLGTVKTRVRDGMLRLRTMLRPDSEVLDR